MHAIDPIVFCEFPYCGSWQSILTNLLHVNLVVGSILLIEAVLFFSLPHKQWSRWFGVAPLAFALAALVLARHMVDLMAQRADFPQFPLGGIVGWALGSLGVTYGNLTLALMFSIVLIPIAIILITLRKERTMQAPFG